MVEEAQPLPVAPRPARPPSSFLFLNGRTRYLRSTPPCLILCSSPRARCSFSVVYWALIGNRVQLCGANLEGVFRATRRASSVFLAHQAPWISPPCPVRTLCPFAAGKWLPSIGEAKATTNMKTTFSRMKWRRQKCAQGQIISPCTWFYFCWLF